MAPFSVSARDAKSAARIGRLRLPHGDIETPVFMPVGTNATVKAVDHQRLESMDVGLILGNTYHLYLRPGLEVIGKAGGLHRFMAWERNILTDSGGFQVFSLSGLRRITEEGVRFQSHVDGSPQMFTPELVLDSQSVFGSDVAMPLDVCSPHGITPAETGEAMEITLRWLERTIDRRRQCARDWNGLLFGIAQGGFVPELRRESARRTAELGVDGLALGGLSVGEPFEEFSDTLRLTAELLPDDRPRYLMGVGTPDYILEAIDAGIDMFDCVLPTRTARNGTVFSPRGPINLKRSYNELVYEPIDDTCECTACTRHTRAYLRHLFKTKEILGMMLATEHNIRHLLRLVDRAKEAIREGTFPDFKRRTLKAYGETES